MDLASLGWDSFFDSAFAPFRDQGLVAARVAMEDKHAYVLLNDQGDFTASVSGKFLHQRDSNAELPKVGDWVAASLVPGEDKAIIHAVLPRRTKLARKVPGREFEEQVLAANIDVAFVTQALDQSFNPRRLERFLIMVHEGGAKPVVVLNKTDLCDALDARLTEAQRAAGSAPIVPACALSGRGMKELREFLQPCTTSVFIGPSGVGKSSLINRLYGEEIQATLEVRESDAKGRHSTTWRELIVLPNGALVIDTPGMREFHIWLANQGLPETFPDIEEIAVRCHFRSCTHTVEKRCAVKEAVEAGQLPRARYENFLKLKHEIDYMVEERRKHTYMARKREAAARRGESV
ncbi:MAG: ribosome small subunit-dependent GTPase A [Verrucomicrobia bacterium]|nr:ribosome small subunit-dependent GTPase A [Verrucomicrobiota bacterium]